MTPHEALVALLGRLSDGDPHSVPNKAARKAADAILAKMDDSSPAGLPAEKGDALAAFAQWDEKKHSRARGKFAEKAGAGAAPRPTPARRRKEGPTVDSLHARVEELRGGPHKLADVLALIKGVASLRVDEIKELRDRLNVQASGGIKEEQAASIVRRALEKAPEPPPADPDAAKLPPIAERLDRLLMKEESGGAPFLDVLLHGLEQHHLVPRGASPVAVLEDLRRQGRGQAPFHADVPTAKLAGVLNAIGKDHGQLTPVELHRLLPHVEYPTQQERGVADKESVLAQRRISREAALASGLLEGGPRRPARSRATTVYGLQEEGETAPQAERPQKASRLPKPYRLEGDPRPVRQPRERTERARGRHAADAAPPGLPPLSERLERIVAHEQSGRAPFLDMLAAGLEEVHAVPEGTHAPALISDLKREAQGHAPLNYSVSTEQIGAALEKLGPDFGVLTAGEMLRILPHLEYPEYAGSADRSLIERRKFPRDIGQRLEGR